VATAELIQLAHQELREFEERIRGLQNSLTRSERSLAELLLDQPEAFALSTVANVARLAGVSDGTVMRFCSSLGYSGFSELKADLQDKLFKHLTVKRLQAAPKTLSTSTSAFRRSVENDIGTLQDILAKVTDKDLERAVALLLSSQRIFTLGLRAAQRLASLASRAFSKLLGNAYLLRTDEGELFDQAMQLTEKDVLLVFDGARYPTMTQQFLRLAHQRGTPIVLVTDHPLAPGTDLAQVVLAISVSSDMPLYSYVAVHAVINGLSAEICERAKDRVADSLKAWEAFIEQTDTFMS